MENELIKNAAKFWKSAEMVYAAGDYTSATILYFKSLFVVLDYIILQIEGRTPKDHAERFRILQRSFPELYQQLDKYYKFYRDTYSISIEKHICEEIRKNVKETIDRYKIQI